MVQDSHSYFKASLAFFLHGTSKFYFIMKKILQNSLKTLIPGVCFSPDCLVYTKLFKHVGYQPFQRLMELYVNGDNYII